jgi:rubredoxin
MVMQWIGQTGIRPWIVHCPDCLATKSLGPEDFNGEAKMIFKCSTCGFENQMEDPEPTNPQDESRLFFGAVSS